MRLLPLLRRSAPARIINVASLGQAPIDFDDPMIEHGYSGTRAYGQSKLAQITTGFELAERLDPKEVTVTSLHPSTYMPTKMVLEEIGQLGRPARGRRRGDGAPRARPGARRRHRPLLRPPAPSRPSTRRPTTARPAAGSGSSRSS